MEIKIGNYYKTNHRSYYIVQVMDTLPYGTYGDAQLINTTSKGSLRASAIKNKHKHEIGMAFTAADYKITKVIDLKVVNTLYFRGSDD